MAHFLLKVTMKTDKKLHGLCIFPILIITHILRVTSRRRDQPMVCSMLSRKEEGEIRTDKVSSSKHAGGYLPRLPVEFTINLVGDVWLLPALLVKS